MCADFCRHLSVVRLVAAVLSLAAVGAASSADAQTIAAGANHSVIVKPDGTVWAVGGNAHGQLGDNTTTTRRSPIQVSALSDVVAVATGHSHTMALTSTGTVYVWGVNWAGQVGDASTTDRWTPVQSNLTGIVAIAAGRDHCVALKSNGDVYTWGWNPSGQLGNGTTTNSNVPVLVMSGVSAIGAGFDHTLFVKSDGTVKAAGENGWGQLGDGTTSDRSTAVPMTGVTGAVSATGGEKHSVILLSGGTLQASGFNGYGVLGDGTTTNRTSAVSVASLTNVSFVRAGSEHTVALKSDGTVYSWGRNNNWQLGNGVAGDVWSPQQIPNLPEISKLGVGHAHNIYVTSDGVVYTSGLNASSQLGDGTTSNRPAPVTISEPGYDWKVSTPTLNVASGTYNTDRTVTVAITTAGATLYYTRNGSEPSTADSTVASGGTITVSTSQTLKVKAFKAGMAPSTTTQAVYVLKVVNVGFSPAPATYTTPRSVTLATSTSGASIYYTTDGGTPSASSALYSGPFTVATGTIVKAIGLKTDWTASDVVSGTYVMNFGPLPLPTADQPEGSYTNTVTVALSALSGSTIRYTSNDTAVQTNSPIYTAPLAFDVSTVIRFKAYHPDYQPSGDVRRSYTLIAATPVLEPTAGTYTAGQVITVTSPGLGTTMRYTINGAEPTTSDPVIASGATLVMGNYTLKAKAFKTGATASATTTAAYAISGSVTPPAMAAGRDHSLAIRSDGVAWGWGENASAQTGYGSSTAPLLLPKSVIGFTGVAQIEGGTQHTHLLTTAGSLWAFGYNANGRLGDGTTTSRYHPIPITSLSGIVIVSGGHEHTLALKSDGTVYAWGGNSFGAVGDGTTTDRPSPTHVASLTSVSAVSAGQYFSLALKQDGTIMSWGRDGVGQLGRGVTASSSSPVPVLSISTATAVSAASSHSLALLSDGTVRAWGYDANGELGNGYSGPGTYQNSPVEVAGLDDVIAIAAGGSFSMALRDDGTVWTWGDNDYGQLGSGTTTDRHLPAQVSGLTDIVSIAAGGYHALALTSDGVVYAWGRNVDGQLGDGTQTTRLAPVAISGPGMAWTVATPTVGLASGLYYATQPVTVTIADPDATIRYTTTGVDPTSSDPTVASGGSIAIEQSQRLKVSGWKAGHVTSVVVARDYELKVVAPAMTPGAGAYGGSQSVAMSTTTSGATIRYTLDGTEPTPSSTAYASAITVADTVTVKARAYKTGWTASDSGHASYWISGGTVATPTITPAGGAHTKPPFVSMSTATSGATVRYTLDGTTPTAQSPVFANPFLVPVTTTVKAKAFKAGYAASATETVTYDVDAAGASATPAIVPGGGWYAVGQTVTITGPSGATLRYTTDGSDPTTSSTSITSGGTVSVTKSQVLKARAWASGLEASAVRRADYVLTGAISAGNNHSLGLAADGTLWAWGWNWTGQLGTPAYTQRTTPVQVMTGVQSIAAGTNHTLAVKTDGTLWAWGATNGPASTVGIPTQVSFTGAVAVAAALSHSLILKSDGTVWAFGDNQYGQLGDGTTTNRRTAAVQVVGLTGVVAIAANRESSYAVQSDGGTGGIVWAWGSNQYGQLGDGSTLPRSTPTRVTGLPAVTAIAAGKLSYFAIAIGVDGRAYGWGQNNNAQLGLGSALNQTSAMPLQSITTGRLVGAGSDYAIAIDAMGRGWAWGNSSTRALAIGPGGSHYDRAYVPEPSDLNGVLSVAGGDIHTLGIRPDGTIRAVGLNANGTLGDGTTTASIDPVTVTGLTLADNAFLAGDADGDDLVTWREYLLGTDPLNADSNGNGVMDGHDEASGASAADPDLDDDGLTNWDERLKGTDPFRADTDGDSVSDLNDAFPLDPTRSMAPSTNPSDTTPPIVTLKEPVTARPIP